MSIHCVLAVQATLSESLTASAWYLVQCKANQDERAEINLDNQGYTCFRPTHQRERDLQGRRRIVRESLFPGYLFIQLGSGESWAPLRSTRGVLRVVSFGGKPLPVGDDLIARLYEHDNGAPMDARFACGERVRIKEGPFVDVEAIFLAMEGEQRVLLLMTLLQREQRISIPLVDISKH
ncbi:transcription/translation regulatory transformer protein RfaH [Pseudomonas sp. GL-R-19]|uniref:transcription/translation regulatory transformer protein RfaH n=1 Tax=Pseudomonas sp. GL-R-19 TaxID=2832391 RepID=UPI001CC05E27|nr:transcription/translation regulatory transformer protein RfaH [Pseudomonas sp. GL-R-19]